MICRQPSPLTLLLFVLGFPLLGTCAPESWSMEITSSAFQNNGNIPRAYACDGADLSPPLAWQNAPSGSATFALIVDDPDAPAGIWVHWLLYELPGSAKEIAAGIARSEMLPNGAKQGINDFGRVGYGGPCPPPGSAHRYSFKLYALDAHVTLKPRATKNQLLDAIQGHTIGTAEIVGRYNR
jgi:Raf kinase inhibitor-like YbhB/YbcL family protein